jgi:hypothetical protein
MSKSKKTTKKKTSSEIVPERKLKTPVKPGCFSMVFTADELITAIQILKLSEEMFEQLAHNMYKAGNASETQIYAARAQLSKLLHDKLTLVAEVGEPISRDVH